MKKVKNFVIGGIENKIFNLVAITILSIILTCGVVLVFQTMNMKKMLAQTDEMQRQSLVQTSTETMEGVIRTTLVDSTKMQAEIADSLFRDLKGEVIMLGDYARKLYTNPKQFPQVAVNLPDKKDAGKVCSQLLTEPSVDPGNPKYAEELGLLGNMSDMMTSQYASNPKLNSSFVASDNGFCLIADDRPEAKFDENGELIHVPITERPWYKGAKKTGDLYFTDVEKDSFTDKIGIVCSMPVYRDGKLVAVVGADLFLDSMQDTVKDANKEGSFIFVINQNGHVIFSPREEGLFQVKVSNEAQDLRETPYSEFSEFVKGALTGSTDVIEVNVEGTDYYVCGAPMPTVGWAVISVVDKKMTQRPTQTLKSNFNEILNESSRTMNKNMEKSRQTILVMLIIIISLGTLNGLVLAKRIVKPLNTMTRQVKEIKGDNLDFEVDSSCRTNDEIEILADAFANLSSRTRQYIDEITRVTAEKERIGAELNVATKIQADMLPRIFPAFPEREEFDLYASMNPAKEVGGDFYDFFLVDEDHLVMVMADVSGKGVPAALFMVIAKTLIKNRAQMGGSPSEILADVNNQLCEGNETDLFVTVWLAILTISTGEGVATNAGHEHPALCRKGGKYEFVTYKHSPAVATIEGMKFKEHEFKLNPGDSVFVYTDGVAEAINGRKELFGPERMLEVLNRNPQASPSEVLSNMNDGILEFVGDVEQFDDITMLCLKYEGPEKKDD